MTSHPLPMSAHLSTHQPWQRSLNCHGSAPSLPPSLSPRQHCSPFQGPSKQD